MPLTPADIANKLFGKQLRGYSMEEVDSFLDQVEAELRRLLTENAEFQRHSSAGPMLAAPADLVRTGDVPDPFGPASTAVATAAPIAAGESQEAALRTLLMAQRTADQAIAEARAEADALVAQAGQRAAQVDREVNARTATALSDLDGRRQELERRIEQLRSFEREYRVRLQAYLESQLRDLDARGGGGADDAGTGVPPAARAAAVGVVPAAVTDRAATAPPATAPPATAPQSPAVAPHLPVGQPPSRPAPTQEPSPVATIASPSEVTAPAGPPREAPDQQPPPRPVTAPPGTGQPMGPFTPAASVSRVEQVDDGPEPPAQT